MDNKKKPSFNARQIDRRDFLKATALASAGLAITPIAHGAKDKLEMPKRRLGKTNEMVSILTVGGKHIAEAPTDEEGVEIVRTAIDGGVNFLDNGWFYHNGKSEEIMAKALKDGYRDKVLLMTKNLKRTVDECKQTMEETLERYGESSIDLMQFHVIGTFDDDVDRLYNSGLIKWAEQARSEGMIKYIGFSAHNNPVVAMDAINRGFDWDTIQMPLNIVDYYDQRSSFQRDVIPLANEKDMGIIGMKSNGYGWDWYTPVAKPVESLRYAMSMNITTVASGMDSLDIVKQNLAAAKAMGPMSEREVESFQTRTKELAMATKEHYKTPPHMRFKKA